LGAVAARYKEIKGLGIEVLAISTNSVFDHKVWQETELSKMVEGGMPFPMLSDPGGRIGSMYGVYEEEGGVDIRGRFIIDPDGIVQSIEMLPESVGRNLEETLRQAQALQHVRATGGKEVTPAGWKPGDKTLKPSPELVGNVWKVWKP
jgi:alkyl hydroperoxide reductase subunit AhpC